MRSQDHANSEVWTGDCPEDMQLGMWEPQSISPLSSSNTGGGRNDRQGPSVQGPEEVSGPMVPCYLDSRGAPEHPAGIVCPRKRQLRDPRSWGRSEREGKQRLGLGFTSRGMAFSLGESRTALQPSSGTSSDTSTKPSKRFSTKTPRLVTMELVAIFRGNHIC